MYAIAEQVLRWLSAGRPVALARTVSVAGMSSRWTGETMAVAGPDSCGTLLAGAATARLRPDLAAIEAGGAAALVRVVVPDAEAGAAGLACGGTAQIFAQAAIDLPADAWAGFAARRPICLVTDLDGSEVGRTTWFGPAAPATERHTEELGRWFGRGATATDVIAGPNGASRLVSAFWPTTRVLVVGDGLLADAIVAQSELLGWTASATVDRDRAVAAISELTSADALVVLTHDRHVDGPVLQTALTGEARAGYVGALGSRRTQAARAGWLADRGVGADLAAAIHGPAGLDIGARTPAEIAVAITAEILATRSGGTGSGLRTRSGPIHHDGLNTPPARYAEGAIRASPTGG
jgi:xanthine dehydrogenase accessory factor